MHVLLYERRDSKREIPANDTYCPTMRIIIVTVCSERCAFQRPGSTMLAVIMTVALENPANDTHCGERCMPINDVYHRRDSSAQYQANDTYWINDAQCLCEYDSASCCGANSADAIMKRKIL